MSCVGRKRKNGHRANDLRRRSTYLRRLGSMPRQPRQTAGTIRSLISTAASSHISSPIPEGDFAMRKITRRKFVANTAIATGAVASFGILTRRADAAEFSYKIGRASCRERV